MPRAADTAYQALRTMILSGEAGGGSRLGEAELAAALGLSRTPVREALQRLDAEGLVKVLPHRGARVVRWTAQDLEEIFELRGRLEPYGAARAARLGPSGGLLADLTELCGAMERAAATRDFTALADLNSRFHGAVLAASGNGRLIELVRGVVHVPIVVSTFERYDQTALRRSMAHHRELVAALRAGDPDWAEAVMSSHLRAAADVLVDQIRQESHESGT